MDVFEVFINESVKFLIKLVNIFSVLFDCFPINWYSLVLFFLGLVSFWWFCLLVTLLLLFGDELGNFYDGSKGGVVTFDTADGVTIDCLSSSLLARMWFIWKDREPSTLKDHVLWHRCSKKVAPLVLVLDFAPWEKKSMLLICISMPCLGEKHGWGVTECLEDVDNVVLLRGGLFAGIPPDILCQ